MNSDEKELKDKVSQIRGKFEKFFSEVNRRPCASNPSGT